MAQLTKDQIKQRFTQARAAREAGKLAVAEGGFEKLAKQVPGLAEVRFNLAEIYAARHKVVPAAREFEAALKLRPKEPAIWVAYLNFAARHPNTDNLAKLVQRAAPVLSGHPAYAYFRAMVCKNAGEIHTARKLFDAAIQGGFKQAPVFIEYGGMLEQQGEDEKALTMFEQALTLQKNNDYALARKTELLRSLGRFEEARVAALEAIESNPQLGAHYYTYATTGKIDVNDPVIPKMKAALKSARPADRSISFLGHALAKAMEDTGQREQVFKYLKLANDETARLFKYDHSVDVRDFAAVRDCFSKLPTVADDPAMSECAPIFVTGLPRSGTTLVERIIAAHSQVAAGGELGILGPILNAEIDTSHPTGEALSVTGRSYEKALHDKFGDIPHVTDKSISTYAHIGLIARALPNARIIVVRRDPCDNALSIYKNMFDDGKHRYSTDLKSIAQMIHLFEHQLDFWRDRCPETFTEVRYEDLVADMENQSRKIVAAAGLEWEDGCLAFHKSKDKVITLSATQVRKPVYSSSVGAWKTYENDMAPFVEAYERRRAQK